MSLFEQKETIEKMADSSSSPVQLKTESYSDDLTSVTVRKERPDQKAGISLVERQGTVFVTRISERGLFHESGIDAGDIVLSINGKRIRKGEGPDELLKAIKKAKDRVTVVVKKANQQAVRGSRSLSPRTQRRLKSQMTRKSHKRDSKKFNPDGSLNLSFSGSAKWESDEEEELMEQVTVEVKKMFDKQPVGLDFHEEDNMIFVSEIDADSPFQDSDLQLDDRIVTINGMSFVRYADAKYAKKILSKAASKITLVVERNSDDGDGGPTRKVAAKKKKKKPKAGDKLWKSVSALSKDDSLGDIKAHLKKISVEEKKSATSSEESSFHESDSSLDIMEVEQNSDPEEEESKPKVRKSKSLHEESPRKLQPAGPAKFSPRSARRSSGLKRVDSLNKSFGAYSSKEKMTDAFNRSLGALSPSGQDRVKKGVRRLSFTSSPPPRARSVERKKTRKSTGSVPDSPVSPSKVSPSSRKIKVSPGEDDVGHDYKRVTVRMESPSDRVKILMRGEKYFIEALPKYESRVAVGDRVLAINGVKDIVSTSDLIQQRQKSVTLTVLFDAAKELTCPCCEEPISCDGKHLHKRDRDDDSAEETVFAALEDDTSERTTRTGNLHKDRKPMRATESIPEG